MPPSRIFSQRGIASATTVFLSIGVTDSGDGTLARLHAVAGLLDSGALAPQQAVLTHLASTREMRTGESSELRQDIERLTAQINGKHGTLGHLPVHYERRDLSTAEQAAFYLAADVMLATPLRDRATAHAAEYVAARATGRGRLILSESPARLGCCRELSSSTRTNHGHSSRRCL